VYKKGSSEPGAVLKVPRLADDPGGVEREWSSLRLLETGGWRLAESVPRALALSRLDGWPVLIKTAVAGRLIGPAVLRSRPEEIVSLVTDWVLALPRLPADEASTREAIDRLVGSALAAFRKRADASAADRQLADQTAAPLERLPGSGLPLVFEHGDLSHPNLLRGSDGRLAVIDWSWASLPASRCMI